MERLENVKQFQQTEFLNTGNTILGIILGVAIVIIIINVIKFAFYEEPSGGKHDASRKPKRRNIEEKEKAKLRVKGGKH